MKKMLLVFSFWTGYLHTTTSIKTHSFSTLLLNLQIPVISSWSCLFPIQKTPRQLICFSAVLSLYSFDPPIFLALLSFHNRADQNFTLHWPNCTINLCSVKLFSVLFFISYWVILSTSVTCLLLNSELRFPYNY